MPKTLAELQEEARKKGGGYWSPIGKMQHYSRVPGRGMQFEAQGEPTVFSRRWMPEQQQQAQGMGMADTLYGQTMAKRMGDLGARGMWSSSMVGQASDTARVQSQLAEWQYGEQQRAARFNEWQVKQQLALNRKRIGLQRAELSKMWNLYNRQLNQQDYWNYMQIMERNAPLPPTPSPVSAQRTPAPAQPRRLSMYDVQQQERLEEGRLGYYPLGVP